MADTRKTCSGLGRAIGVTLVTSLCLGLAAPSLAAGGGVGTFGKQRAVAAYKKGEKLKIQGVEYLQEAAESDDPEGQKEALANAERQFKRALRKFKKATRRDRKFHEAYNEMGFAQRMLGKYEDALESYDKALELDPGFPYAVEYRGEAYMRLGRLDDAKAAYMELFGNHRKLADMLMTKMKAWVSVQREKPDTQILSSLLDAFARWVDERVEIANQTAALVDGETPRSW